MAFLVILRKTLIDLTGLKGNLVILVIGIGISFLLSLAWGQVNDFTGRMTSAEIETIEVVSAFLMSAFMWGAGFFLAIVISVKGAGLISRESSDGTLTLLVSRPVNRWQILAGKFVALVVYGILLDLIILLLAALIFNFVKPTTGETLMVLLSAILRLLPYILLVTVIFASISIAVSTVTSRRIAVTAVMCAVVAVIYFFLPMILLMLYYDPGNDASSPVYVNLAGHLGNIYITLVQSIEGGHIVENLYESMWPYVIGNEPDTLSMPVTGYTDLALNSTEYPFEFILRLNPLISLGVWLSIIVACLGIAFRSIERKQVT